MARAMKDSGIAWIGQIPEEWGVVALKYFCTMQAGKNLVSEQITEKGLYPVYGGNGKRGFFSEYNCEGEKLVVGRQGALCGNVHKVAGRIWATEHAIITNATSLISQNYLYYLLIGMNLNRYVSSTAAQPGLAVSTIQNVRTCLPTLEEQERIARFLDAKCSRIDVVIKQTRASIEEYKKLKQAVITQAVTKGIRPNRTMKESGIDWIGEIPADWIVYRIASLYDERNESGTNDLPILTISINSGISDHEVADEEQARVFVRSEDKTKYKRVYPGDLAYNMMRAWQGAFGAVRVDGMISPAYVVAKPKQRVALDSRYVEALLRTPAAIEEMHRYSHGITDFRLRLYWQEFKNIRICVPDIYEQHKIADYIDNENQMVEELIAKKELIISELLNYKKSMIYEYVTGKKEVQ